MNKYRILVHGQNVLTEADGVLQRLGFYTNVFVEAYTPEAAVEQAFDILREDTELRDLALNDEDDLLRFTADEVHEIESFEDITLPRTGLALYSEDEEDEEDLDDEE
jgi:hypothetical protein